MISFWSHRKTLDVKQLKRVLMIHPFGIGDTLFMTPVIRALKEHGVEQIDLLLGSRTREVFRHHPFVNQIFEWDKSDIKVLELIKLFWNLRWGRYQAAIDLSCGRQYAFFSWMVWGIPIRIGFNFKNRGTFLTHKVDLPEGFKKKPVVEYYRDLIKFLSIEMMSMEFEFFLSHEDQRDCSKKLSELDILNTSYIVVAPGGGESWGKDARLRHWPVDFFAQFVRQVNHQYSSFFKTVLILGGRNDRRLGDELSGKLTDFKVHNLCGALPLRLAGALIERASLFVANDGGLVHVARALKAPMVAIYGSVDPAVYGPYPPHPLVQAITNTGPECRPCYQKMRYNADCVGVECLTTLTPDFVLATLKSRGFFDQLCAQST